MFRIENDGPSLIDTDYFGSEQANNGYAFLSINAGAFRLLLPDSIVHFLPEMRTAHEVIVTRGQWTTSGRTVDAYELLFEDDSDTPFALNIMTAQSDRLLGASDQSGTGTLRFDVIVAPCAITLTLPARFRVSDTLPCLKPWS